MSRRTTEQPKVGETDVKQTSGFIYTLAMRILDVSILGETSSGYLTREGKMSMMRALMATQPVSASELNMMATERTSAVEEA